MATTDMWIIVHSNLRVPFIPSDILVSFLSERFDAKYISHRPDEMFISIHIDLKSIDLKEKFRKNIRNVGNNLVGTLKACGDMEWRGIRFQCKEAINKRKRTEEEFEKYKDAVSEVLEIQMPRLAEHFDLRMTSTDATKLHVIDSLSWRGIISITSVTRLVDALKKLRVESYACEKIETLFQKFLDALSSRSREADEVYGCSHDQIDSGNYRAEWKEEDRMADQWCSLRGFQLIYLRSVVATTPNQSRNRSSLDKASLIGIGTLSEKQTTLLYSVPSPVERRPDPFVSHYIVENFTPSWDRYGKKIIFVRPDTTFDPFFKKSPKFDDKPARADSLKKEIDIPFTSLQDAKHNVEPFSTIMSIRGIVAECNTEKNVDENSKMSETKTVFKLFDNPTEYITAEIYHTPYNETVIERIKEGDGVRLGMVQTVSKPNDTNGIVSTVHTTVTIFKEDEEELRQLRTVDVHPGNGMERKWGLIQRVGVPKEWNCTECHQAKLIPNNNDDGFICPRCKTPHSDEPPSSFSIRLYINPDPEGKDYHTATTYLSDGSVMKKCHSGLIFNDTIRKIMEMTRKTSDFDYFVYNFQRYFIGKKIKFTSKVEEGDAVFSHISFP